MRPEILLLAVHVSGVFIRPIYVLLCLECDNGVEQARLSPH